MKKIVLITLVFMLIMKIGSFAQTNWELDKAHAKVGFSATHLMVSEVEGFFRNFDAKLTTTKDDFSDATAEMTAQVGSINTEIEKRDQHLKSQDFFDAEKFPVITFKSKKFNKIYDKNYKVTGELTIKNVTKTITLDVIARTAVNPMNNKTVAGFKITGKIKRTDFNVGSSFPKMVVSDEIDLIANVEFTK